MNQLNKIFDINQAINIKKKYAISISSQSKLKKPKQSYTCIPRKTIN